METSVVVFLVIAAVVGAVFFMAHKRKSQSGRSKGRTGTGSEKPQ